MAGIILTEEQMERICDELCRFPYTVQDADLEQICKKCPLSDGESQRGQLRSDCIDMGVERVYA